MLCLYKQTYMGGEREEEKGKVKVRDEKESERVERERAVREGTRRKEKKKQEKGNS